MKEFLSNALDTLELTGFVEATFEILKLGSWSIDQLRDPSKRQVIMNALKDPYRDKNWTMQMFQDCELNEGILAKVYISATAIADAIADHAKESTPIEETRKRQKTLLDADSIINTLSDELKALFEATKDGSILRMAGEIYFPYPQERLRSMYIRSDYDGMFQVLIDQILKGNIQIPISGTPGIGKSLFFIYLLFRIIQSLEDDWSPYVIIYQSSKDFFEYNLSSGFVAKLKYDRAFHMVHERTDIWYIIDGQYSEPLTSICPTIYLASPRSKYLSEYCKKKHLFYFPVWHEDEIWECRNLCYSDIPDEVVFNRFRRYGGIPRHIYFSKLPDPLDIALSDASARQFLRDVESPTQLFGNSHKLMHCVVTSGITDLGEELHYQFKHMCIASEYIGRQLWIGFYDEMMTKLQESLGGSPSVINRYLFEFYGHLCFESGVKNLKCRSLENEKDQNGVFSLGPLQPIEFSKSKLIHTIDEKAYYKPRETNFEAIDSLCSSGMFQFTMSKFHDIKGIQTLLKLEKLYDAATVPLYFVVPSEDTFLKIKKQEFKVGSRLAKEFPKKIRQYALLLPIGLQRFDHR